MKELVLGAFGRSLRALPIAKRMQTVWPLLVPNQLARLTSPLSFDGQTLVVSVTSPAAAQEVQLLKRQILQTLTRHQEQLALPAIADLACKVSTQPNATPPPRRPPPRRKKSIPPQLARDIEELDDDELGASLRNLIAKSE